MKVRGLFFLIFICSFLINNLSAQSSAQIKEQKTCFPLWVFEDSLYVGISDPFVSKEKAKQQAVERALFFYAIKNKGISILETSELYEKTKGEINSTKNDKMLQTILFSVGLKRRLPMPAAWQRSSLPVMRRCVAFRWRVLTSLIKSVAPRMRII